MQKKSYIGVSAAILFGLAALSATAPASASARQDNHVKHVQDCLALLFTDPAAHASSCPGDLGDFESLSPGSEYSEEPAEVDDGCSNYYSSLGIEPTFERVRVAAVGPCDR